MDYEKHYKVVNKGWSEDGKKYYVQTPEGVYAVDRENVERLANLAEELNTDFPTQVINKGYMPWDLNRKEERNAGPVQRLFEASVEVPFNTAIQAANAGRAVVNYTRQNSELHQRTRAINEITGYFQNTQEGKKVSKQIRRVRIREAKIKGRKSLLGKLFGERVGGTVAGIFELSKGSWADAEIAYKHR